LNHHRPGLQLRRAFTPRIAHDLQLSVHPEQTDRKLTTYDQLISRLTGEESTSGSDIRQLAEIIEVADHFDDEIEFAPYAASFLSDSLAEGCRDSLENPATAFVLPVLRGCTRDQLEKLTPLLPVFPKAAMEVLGCIRRKELSVEKLAHLAGSDQVLAGALIKGSNSAAYSHIDPVRDLQTAVMYLGTQRTADLLFSAAIRPILMTPDFRDLWQHSLDVANAARTLALKSRDIGESDAYLVGLLHDVGKLLLRLVPSNVSVIRHRLIEAGCAPAIAEVLTCGVNHAQAGAIVMRSWQMPEDFIAAVECHHEPERCSSPMASLLYLLEHWSDSEEDLPSTARLKYALERTGLRMEDVDQLRLEPSGTSRVM
jgi:putative nucleotidyltransferase with HDIG domain